MDIEKSKALAQELVEGFIARGVSKPRTAHAVARLPLDDRKQVQGDVEKLRDNDEAVPTSGEITREGILVEFLARPNLNPIAFEHTLAGPPASNLSAKKRHF
ncbi:MAG TPA: hypothetical protein VNA13_04505 [Xanthomonadales bacterium]|nr:hypothetical protein [Xanthomonadales bacterium]